jgi:hypothetical protein
VRYLRWAVTAFLIASIAYSARELMTVAAAAKQYAAGGAAQATAAMKLMVPAASVDAMSSALEQNQSAAPIRREPGPPVDHAEMSDTNSGGGKVFTAKGGADRAAVSGGGVIINADGSRLELAPPTRPKPAQPSTVTKTVTAMRKAQASAALPALLDDPTADLATRKRRAEIMLGACAVGAFALVLWARRWRPS